MTGSAASVRHGKSVSPQAMPRTALADTIDDAVRSGLQGTLDHVVTRVSSMVDQTLPTDFENLFDGGRLAPGLCQGALALRRALRRGRRQGRGLLGPLPP